MTRYIAWIEPSFAEEGITRRDDRMTVFEPEGNMRKTGLLDARGNELYAVKDLNPIGFTAKVKE